MSTTTEEKKTNGQQSKAIVTGPQARLNNIKSLFEKSKGSIAAVLPKHLTPERLIKIATSAASRTPDLLICTPESLLLAVVQAGTLGLEPSTPLGHAYLVPYQNKNTGKSEATLIIGYKGLCQLAYQSGDVTTIYAHEVCANDSYDIELGTSKRLFHKPAMRDRGEVLGFYAVMKFKHGGEDFCWMTKEEVDAIRAKSQGRNADAWTNHYNEQGKKTAIRRLAKTAPMSTEKFQRAVAIDDRANSSDAPDYSDVIDVIGVEPDEPEPSRTESLGDRLAAKVAS